MTYFNPDNYTYAELSRIREAEGQQELANAYDLLDTLDKDVKEYERKWDKEDCFRDEQSEFRRQLLGDILDLVPSKSPRYKETKELISEVLGMIQESMVEL